MMASSIFLFIGWFSVIVTVVVAAKWDYSTGAEGPDNWKDEFPFCDDSQPGSRQSPVNIERSTVQYNSSLQAVNYTNYEFEDADVNFELKNNGHTVVVTPKFKETEKRFPKVIYHQIGGASSPYKLIQFHFHWGSNKTVGSEHTIDGKHYQIEVHFVHMNMKYTDFNVAKKETDGLLVVGSFLTATNMKNHTGYQPLISHFKYVENTGQDRMIPSFVLNNLLPSNKDRVYFYEGSLTTPGCFKSVKWFVNDEPIEISKWQMSQFLTLMTTQGDGGSVIQLVNNFRPVQKLHKRIIMTTIDPDASSAFHHRISVWLFSFALVLVGYQLS